VKRLVLVVLAIAALATAGMWGWIGQSLPSLDGERRVSGLHAPVEVLTDGHGVPHVYASGPDDAWFAAGVLHARDRLWQMELYRRAAYGRLSEILGPDTLPIDRRFLTLGLRHAAEAEWGAMAPEVREALERYADGVNAQIAEMGGRLKPIEFQLLRFTPAAWSPVDSLAVGRLLSWRLAENHQAELVRYALAARFGAGEAFRLTGRYPSDAPTVMQGAGRREPTETANLVPESGPAPAHALPIASAETAPVHRIAPIASVAAIAPVAPALPWPPGLEWLHPTARRGNSNNWVIAGRRTASGRPLLANDPHLQLEFPGIWYEMHLVAAGLDVIGVSVPGTPFVVIGHNGRIAWGLTNTGADVQDLYIDRIDVARRRYWAGGQWAPVTVTPVEIPVRGEDPYRFEVWRTRHGSVYAEVGLEWEDAPSWLSPTAERRGERRAFVLRWDVVTGETAGAFEALNRAADWTSFLAAVERFSAPSQNIVYADVDGNIGYAMSGTLPLRAGGVGAMPNDGGSGEGEWSGRVLPSMLPRLYNPPRGYITSSNNQIDRQWAGFITRDWAAPHRARRLNEVLETTTSVDLQTAAAWQNDVTGLGPNDILGTLDRAMAAGQQRGAETIALDVLSQLKNWNRRVDDRPVVTLYQLFEHILWRRTFFDEMGDPLFSRFYEWAGAERPSGLFAVIDDPDARWFDDVATLERRETRDDMMLLAAADAGRLMTTQYRDRGSWGSVHAALFEHPLSRGGWPISAFLNRGPSAMVGDGTTVMRVSYHRLRPFSAWEIPSWRQIFEVGNWDEARVVLPGGQSGHPLSPHYFDQNEMWRLGHYRQQPYSRRAVDAARAHRQVLVP
jgi:penicillin amidase